MRTTVDLDPALLKRLRVEARKRGVSIKELLAAALHRGLESENVPAGRYRVPTFRLGAPRSGLDLDKALAIAGELEADEVARDLRLRK